MVESILADQRRFSETAVFDSIVKGCPNATEKDVSLYFVLNDQINDYLNINVQPSVQDFKEVFADIV